MVPDLKPDEHGNGGRVPPTGRISFDEFLAWIDEVTLAEWVNGEVVMMTPAGNVHQETVCFLVPLLRHFVERWDLGIIRPAPFLMKLGPDLSAREPDIIFVQNARRSLLKASYLDGPADLLVEVINPDSRARDRGEKYYEYEQAGVREYWLIDPQRRVAEFYVAREGGIFGLQPVDEEGIFRSVVLPGLWLKVEWLFSDPLPKLMDVLRAWNLV